MDDVIRLVKTKYTRDAEGNQKPEDLERTVFCKVNSVARSEFYAAAQAGLHPEYIFVLSHFRDYEGEKIIKYTDWLNREHTLYVTRAYRIPDADTLEITAEERTGYGLETEPGSGSECCPD